MTRGGTSEASTPGGAADDLARRRRAQAQRLEREAERFERGAEGERIVAAALAQLPTTFRVLHDLDVPGSKVNVDHLAVGPSGVFVIAAKYSTDELKAGKGMLLNGRHSVRRECDTVTWQAGALSEILGQPVEPILCFVGTKLPARSVQVEGVTVCNAEWLVDQLAARPPRLNTPMVAEIARHAAPLVRHQADPPTLSPTPSLSPLSQRASDVPTDESSSSARDVRRQALVAVGCLAVAIAGVFLVLAIGRLFGGSNSDASEPPSTQPIELAAEVPTVTVATTETTAATTTSSIVVSTTVPAVPSASFTCTSSVEGWAVAAIPTEYRVDEGGYLLWYRIGEEPWEYWGEFQNGVKEPSGLSGLEPGSEFSIGLGAGLADDPSEFTQVLDFVVPDDPC